MKLFKCQNCSLILFFENRNCKRCGYILGYIPHRNELSALEAAGNQQWRVVGALDKQFKFCANAQRDACNWLLPAESMECFCIACRHNRVVPDLSDQDYLRDWQKMESAKHRLFYTLLRLDLPMYNRADDPNNGLAFDFLAEPVSGEKVVTGHDNGIITLALKEADDVEREARRTHMGEFYRTLLGHFRHEIGHYYWDRLVADENRYDEYRALFGDEREDYNEALERYYQQGAPANWQDSFISAYATSHSWEDFAETWAHYLHIIDGLETSHAFGLEVHPAITSDQELHADAALDPYKNIAFDDLIEIWLPLTYALNAMNRSMGSADLYPFVISPIVVKKLAFIHALVHAAKGNAIQNSPVTS